MMLHWATSYLGRPWQVGAAGPEAYDCWGLVRAIYLDQLGVDLPAAGFTSEDVKTVLTGFRNHPERKRWHLVEAAAEFDALLLAQARHPIHVGVWVTAGGGRVVHAVKGPGVVAQDLLSLKSSGYQVMGVYRHDSRIA